MLLKMEGLAAPDKEQEKAATCFNSHFPLHLEDEIFFDVTVWDKSLLFFCGIWRFGASLGRRQTPHTRHTLVPSGLWADVRSDQVKAPQRLL